MLFFTLALICENNFDCAYTLVDQSKDLMNTVATLMQVSEEGKTQDRNERRRLVKGASVLVASLSAVREGSNSNENSERL